MSDGGSRERNWRRHPDPAIDRNRRVLARMPVIGPMEARYERERREKAAAIPVLRIPETWRFVRPPRRSKPDLPPPAERPPSKLAAERARRLRRRANRRARAAAERERVMA